MLNLVTSTPSDYQDFTRTLDEIAREGARRMLQEALEARYVTTWLYAGRKAGPSQI
jgi:hypothetical protein